MELPRYKRPKEIIFADIPRNATGKIEKPKLRKMYGADRLVEQENKGWAIRQLQEECMKQAVR